MCLTLEKNAKRLVADKDIICYKYIAEHLKDYFDLKGKLVTPYMDSVVKIGQTYNSKLIKIVDEFEDDEVEIGIHSFVNQKDCELDVMTILESDKKYRVVSCTIPKGSEYYVGTFCHLDCYASTSLKYNKVLKIIKQKY